MPFLLGHESQPVEGGVAKEVAECAEDAHCGAEDVRAVVYIVRLLAQKWIDFIVTMPS